MPRKSHIDAPGVEAYDHVQIDTEVSARPVIEKAFFGDGGE